MHERRFNSLTFSSNNFLAEQIRNFEWLVLNALLTIFPYFRYPQQLENWPESAKSFQEAGEKIYCPEE